MTEDSELDRRTVLEALGTSAVVAGLAGCAEDSSEDDNGSDDNASAENGDENGQDTGEDRDGEDGEDTDGEDGEGMDGEDTDGEDGEDMDGEDGEDTDGEDGEDGTMVEGDVTVQLSETAFEPVLVEIEPGQTVVWANEDDSAHDVTASQFTDAATEWSLSVAPPPGEAVSHTFEEAGVYEYFCTIHGESTSCGAVVVGDPETVRPLSCMGIDQIQQYFDTLDVLDPERPYGIDIEFTATGTSMGEQTSQLSLQEGANDNRKMTITAQTQQQGEITSEFYFEGNTAFLNVSGVERCVSIPNIGDNPFEAINQSGGGQTGGNTPTVETGQFNDAANYERKEELQTALEPVDTTTIDGVRTIVCDIDLQAFRELYEGSFQNVDVQEFKAYIRTDNWHVVRQDMEFATDQGQTSAVFEYYAFGEPFNISNPC